MTKRLLCLLMALLLIPAMACGAETAPENAEPLTSPLFQDSAIPAFTVTSENLTDGVWDLSIGKHSGENLSPQLSWEPVTGAACYVIYMVDTKALDFVHWMSNHVTETTLPQGRAGVGEYVGPYPPAFETHPYDVYVLALREPVEDLKSAFGVANVFFTKNLFYLDAPAEGVTGNLLGYGYLTGTYDGRE